LKLWPQIGLPIFSSARIHQVGEFPASTGHVYAFGQMAFWMFHAGNLLSQDFWDEE
jgi:hypothetical protein